jgi:cytochrome c oxidase subunit I
VFWRERAAANPWRSRGLEWQIPSPPPPGNFTHVPVVLSAPYLYGFKDAPPVADLNPPVGVLSAAVAAAEEAKA